MNGPGLTDEPAPWPRQKKLKAALLAVVAVLVGTFIWFRMTYPYGVSHCCSAGIGLALTAHAKDHEGWFPFGRHSPEASLSLLCLDSAGNLEWIRGKTISRSIAQAAWAKNGELGPDSCGWHYVEGLRDGDDPAIAVVWDKAWGLGHNSQRIRGFGREIILADGSQASKLLKDWPRFAMDQREKLAKLIAQRGTNGPPIRWSDEETLGTNWFPQPKPN